MNSKQKTALILNIIIFIFMVVGTIMTFAEIKFVDVTIHEHGLKVLKFFTVQSNLFGGIVSLIYVIYLLRQSKTGKPIPHALNVIKFIATIDLVITFLVVALFLGFIIEDGYFSVFVNANLFFHLLIPLLSFVSFTLYEEKPNFKYRYVFYGIIHLIAYSIFYLIVVLTHMENGKVAIQYDWYAFAQLGLPIALVIDAILMLMGFLIATLIWKIHQLIEENK